MAFLSADFDAFIRLAVESLLNGFWQGAALTALVWCLLRLIRGINATTRYLIWGVTLLAVISLPLLYGARSLYASHGSESAQGFGGGAAVASSAGPETAKVEEAFAPAATAES